MYYDSFAPRTGPAAMPSPRSRIAPYFSGRVGTFDDFLEEFEARAYDCRLTDPQRVDALVCYVDPSLRKTCKSLNGYQSCEWSLFRHSLVNVFGTTIPRYQITKQKLRNLVEDSCRMRMDREEDVLQYYRTFKHYSDPLVRSGHLTETNRDVEFWYGFHPHDRDILWQRLLAVYPFHRHGIPFHFENVFDCACRAFAYEECLSFWPRDQEFEHRNITRRCPSSSYPSDPRPFPSFSCMFSESQYTPAPSVTKLQPEPEPESETMPSITPTSSSAPSLASSCTNNVPESELEPLSNTLTSPPLLQLSSSMCSFTDIVPESESKTMPSIILPTSPSLPRAPSLQSSCTDVVPEPKSISEHTSLYSSPLTSPLLPSLSLHSSCADADAEPEPMSSPSSISSTVSECLPSPLRSATEAQLETECKRSAFPSSSSVAPLPSLFDSPPFPPVSLAQSLVLGDQESRSSLSPVDNISFSAPEPSPEQGLESCEAIITLASELVEVSNTGSIPLYPTSRSQERTIRVTPSKVMLMPKSLAASPPLEVSNAPVQVWPNSKSQEVRLGVTPHEVMPEVTSLPTSAKSSLHSDHSHVSPRPLSTVEISSSNRDLPSSLCKVLPVRPMPPLETSWNVPSRALPQPPPGLVQDDLLSDSLEDSLTIPIHSHSTPLQRPLGIIRDDSVLITLEVTLAPTSPAVPSILQQRLLEVTHPEVSSTLAPHLHFTSLPSPLSSSARSARFDFPLILVTIAVLFSALLDFSTIITTRSHKFLGKNEDISNDRNSITMPGNTFDFVQPFQLVQYKPHAVRYVFDPGGLV